jgi:hypothetical protein
MDSSRRNNRLVSVALASIESHKTCLRQLL